MLLSDTSLPLWTWIVIIVVACLVIIGTTAFTVRCIVVRRRQADFVETFGDNLPQRRVTVRRGQVVDQNKYLSLTGSKFGLNAFTADDGDSRAGARSKSPFEWWSSFKDRSQSRNSQTSQMSTNYTIGTMGTVVPTSPGQNHMYQRRDLNYSSTSLGSSVNGKDNETTISVTEEEPTSPSVRNFSRSFSQQSRYSGYGTRVRALSRIDEAASPHVSMISSHQSRTASMLTDRRDTRTGPSPLASLQDIGEVVQRPAAIHGADQNRTTSNQHHNDMPTSPLVMEPMRDMAYGGSRASYGNADHGQRGSVVSVHGSGAASTNNGSGKSSVTALPQAPPQPDDPRPTSSDMSTPRRSSSFKKGKVLRKKSLKRAELVTQVDS